DIKPENIMVTKDGIVKLADLGLALQLEGGEEDSTGTAEAENGGKVKVMGTPRYMSPEQCRGKAVDSRTDQYLLGGTLFHMMTGHAPYEGLGRKDLMRAQVLEEVPDPAQHMNMPEAWRILLMRMLAKKPDDRIPNAEQVHEAVRMATNGEIYSNARRGARRTGGGAGPAKQASNLIMYAVIALVIVIVVIVMSGTSEGTVNTQPEDGPHTKTDLELALERARDFIDNVSPGSEGSSEEFAFAVKKISEHENFSDKTPVGTLLRDAVLRLEDQQGDKQTAIYNTISKKIKDAQTKQKISKYQEAQSILQGISKSDREIVKDEWQKAWDSLNKEITEKIKYYLTVMSRAKSIGELDGYLKELKLKTLYLLRKKDIDNEYNKRLAFLKKENDASNKRNKATQDKKDLSTWKTMVANLSRHRGTTNFKGFIDVATKASKDLFDSKLKSAAKAYADLGRRVQNIDKDLDSYLKSSKPSFSFNGRTVRCIGLKNDSYIVLLKSPNNTSDYKRSEISIPIETFLNDALKKSNASQRKNFIAMYLFYWQHPFFGQHANPLPKVDKKLQQFKVFRIPNPAQADNFHVDFADAAVWKNHFTGANINFNRNRLTWFTDQEMKGNIAKEKENKLGLSNLIFKPGLKGGVLIDTKLRIQPDSFILVGVKRGNNIVRFAFNNKSDFIGAVATNGNGLAQMYPVGGAIPGKKVMKKDVKLSIDVNKQGHVVFKMNNKTLKQLDPSKNNFNFSLGAQGGNVQFIIQGCKLGGTNSGCEIIDLKVTQNR
ncbi:MAG: serine/threonine protein kinase, partial [Planctomycetes bacterium]|nr:serine/threonine protein kinase [Planctomycetota bacterium]